MIILKEEKQIQTLPSGTIIGSEKDIVNWSSGTALPGIFYHYSPNREKILQDGFRLSSNTYLDGIYFAYDDKFSKGYGNGNPPIKVRIKVQRDKLLSGKRTDTQKQIISEWEEDEPELAKRLESGEDVGILGKFMLDCGFLVMNDGIQIIVQSPKCIGIILG